MQLLELVLQVPTATTVQPIAHSDHGLTQMSVLLTQKLICLTMQAVRRLITRPEADGRMVTRLYSQVAL
ncbi:hypothetical protein WJX77_002155 [Trebouxia sp. C0004]